VAKMMRALRPLDRLEQVRIGVRYKIQPRRAVLYWKWRTASIIFLALYGLGTNRLPVGISSLLGGL